MQSDNEMEKPKGGGDDFEHDLEANASAFEALERDFQEVICVSLLFLLMLLLPTAVILLNCIVLTCCIIERHCRS